jgi:hypothetical protein
MAKPHYHVKVVGSPEVLPDAYTSEADAQDALADLEYDALVTLDIEQVAEYTIVMHNDSHEVVGEVDVIV